MKGFTPPAELLERTPEPELMEGEEQARAYAEADFEAPHQRFVEELQARLPGLPEAGAALDLGCGPADVTVRVAKALPGWSVDGLDGSTPMLQHGRERIRREGLASRVRLIRARLPGADAPRSQYDLVLSNSLLHHLADPGILWSAVRRFARRGAALLVMDLLRPQTEPDAKRLVEEYAAGEPRILRDDFFRSLLAAYRPEEVRAQLGEARLARVRVEALGDRHWIAWGRI